MVIGCSTWMFVDSLAKFQACSPQSPFGWGKSSKKVVNPISEILARPDLKLNPETRCRGKRAQCTRPVLF